jgi:hypothetical protein
VRRCASGERGVEQAYKSTRDRQAARYPEMERKPATVSTGEVLPLDELAGGQLKYVSIPATFHDPEAISDNSSLRPSAGSRDMIGEDGPNSRLAVNLQILS